MFSDCNTLAYCNTPNRNVCELLLLLEYYNINHIYSSVSQAPSPALAAALAADLLAATTLTALALALASATSLLPPQDHHPTICIMLS